MQELQNGIDNGITADAGGILKAPVTDFTCPAAVAKQTGRLTWIYCVMFNESPANFSKIYAGSLTSDVSFKL